MQLSPLASKILLDLLKNLQIYLTKMMALIQPDIRTTFISLTAAYILYVCWQGFMGKCSKDKLSELGISVFVLIFISTSVINSNFYLNSIVFGYSRFLINTTSWFASTGQIDNFLEIFKHLDSGFALISTSLLDQIPDGNFVTNAGEYFRAWVAMIAFSLSFGMLYVGFILMIILPLFAVHILFVLGIFCVFLGAFKETRHIFWACIKAIANYSLIMIFSAIVMSVAFTGLENSLTLYATTLVAKGIFNSEFATVIVWSLVCFGVLLKVPDLAAAMSGGTAGSTSGIVGVMALTGGLAIAGAQAAGSRVPSVVSGAAGAIQSGAGKALGIGSKWARKAGE